MTDTLSPNQAARQCAVSVRTVRRWLAAGVLEGAYRDAEGLWHIPPTALLDRLPTSRPEPERAPIVPSDAEELKRLTRELARVNRDLIAERYVNELLSKNLEDVRLALRALGAGSASDRVPSASDALTAATPTPGAPEVVEGSTERHQKESSRRWWHRG